MLFRPAAGDLRTIGRFTGKVVYGVGLAMLAHAPVAWLLGEPNEALAFVIGAALALAFGAGSQLALPASDSLGTSQGLATVGLVWAVVPVFGAVPLVLSGHYAYVLDAYFEAVSGFSTIGLTLVNDVDHLARSINLWRHAMHFLGGMGIVIVVLTIFATASGAVGTLYTGEGRAEKILPNIVQTTRFIVRVVTFYVLLGVPLLWAAMVATGMRPGSAVFHALTMFSTAFHTGGFAPMSSSAGFYRSALVEAMLVVLMFAGAFSYALHYQLWQGRRAELTRNLETRTLALSVLALFGVMAFGLARAGTYTDFGELFRVGFFQIVSAHTTTGLATVPDSLFVTDWGVLAPATIVTAMALGGMAGSTGGGIKAVRIGLIAKGLRRDVRQVLLPENAVVIEHYHSTTRRILRDDQIRGAATILLLYFLLYLGGGIVGLFYGYELQLALFESTAAAATGGLSVGLVRPDLEWPLKVLYILQMLAGRLEFIALFALAGYALSVVRGRA